MVRRGLAVPQGLSSRHGADLAATTAVAPINGEHMSGAGSGLLLVSLTTFLDEDGLQSVPWGGTSRKVSVDLAPGTPWIPAHAFTRRLAGR